MSALTTPDVIFENDDLIAINKPHGLLVHRSRMAPDAKEFALQMVRNHIGKRVYPAHRIDRKTSGVLLFTKSKHANQQIQKLFREGAVEKTYAAIVRGHLPDFGEIDYPLTEDTKTRHSLTNYKTVQQFEIGIPSGKFDTSRYSLLEIKPATGRFHQIRKHMAHIFHPIIGDRPHGCNKQNRIWKQKFGLTSMMLHASSLRFHVDGDEEIRLYANLSAEFQRVLKILATNNIYG